MNWKKILFIIIVFMTFLGTGAMLSNVQSRAADQLLDAHGLSNNTRYFYTNKNEKISDFLKYLEKKYPNEYIQLHLDNREVTNQVLVWANHKTTNLPTQSGRYFTLDDFKGQVSFAILGPDAVNDAVEFQNNKYIIDGKHYYSVIGVFKNYHQNEQEKYYLTTGIDQPTAQGNLKNYRIVIDSPNKNIIRKIAKKYNEKLYIPIFVKNHQFHRFSVLSEISITILLWITAILANSLIALMQWRQIKRTNLKGSLLRNWIMNRSSRLFLIEAILAIVAYFFLRTHAFISNANHLAFLIIFNWVIAIIAYIIKMVLLYNKEKHKNA